MAKKSRKDMKAPSKEKSNFLGASGFKEKGYHIRDAFP